VVFAAVSSAPQAEDEKASIPSQIENARALIQRRGWSEAHPPLVVPGISRSIDFLHEALEEIPALKDLVDLAKHNALDLVICRDYDRLARTRTLLTQLSSYLSRCNVQIYAMDKPVEPIPAGEFQRRRGGLTTSATVEAFAGLEAEREVDRIRERRYFGMNAEMRRGRWAATFVSFGYRRDRQTEHGRVIMDVPEVCPEEAEIVHRIDSLYLSGMSARSIARQLNLENVPSARGVRWTDVVVLGVLKNPFYAGYVVWGTRRARRVYNPDTQSFKSKLIEVPSYARLREALGGPPGLCDLLSHREELERDDVVIVRGLHEPLRTEEEQHAIDAEIRLRRDAGGRGASLTSKAPRVFGGLVMCGECGHAFKGFAVRSGRVYYRCSYRAQGATCGNAAHITEEAIYEAVITVLTQLAADPDSIQEYLQSRVIEDAARLEEEQAGLEKALAGLTARRTRWDQAYEAGTIDLTTYGERVGGLADEQAGLENRLGELIRKQAAQAQVADLQAEIQNAVTTPPDLSNPAEAKRLFRSLIQSLTVTSGQVTEIVFRT